MTEVAVVIPVHDGARFLGEALESVITQSLPPSEIVVVDDGSTDDSAAVADAVAGVRVVSQAAQGAAAARNRGVRATTAPLIAFLDADDLMEPSRLAVQRAALLDDDHLAGVLGWSVPFADDRPEVFGHAVPGHLAGAMMVRRSTFDRVGPFDPNLQAGEFGDWYLRAREAGHRIDMLETIVMRRRSHDANLTRNADQVAAGYLHVARLAIERRRKRDTDGGNS